MITYTVRFDGDLLRELQDLGAGARPRAKAILSRFLTGVTARAKALAPDDPAGATPDLKASIRGSIRQGKGGIRASVIAGGTPLDAKLAQEHRRNPAEHQVYAVVQHEDTTLRHRHGQANFIGAPFMAALPAMTEEFDKELLSARA